MARFRRRGEPAKLPGTTIYRVEHPAVDRGARRTAWYALIASVFAVGFTVTILAWAMWSTA